MGRQCVYCVLFLVSNSFCVARFAEGFSGGGVSPFFIYTWVCTPVHLVIRRCRDIHHISEGFSAHRSDARNDFKTMRRLIRRPIAMNHRGLGGDRESVWFVRLPPRKFRCHIPRGRKVRRCEGLKPSARHPLLGLTISYGRILQNFPNVALPTEVWFHKFSCGEMRVLRF